MSCFTLKILHLFGPFSFSDFHAKPRNSHNFPSTGNARISTNDFCQIQASKATITWSVGDWTTYILAESKQKVRTQKSNQFEKLKWRNIFDGQRSCHQIQAFFVPVMCSLWDANLKRNRVVNFIVETLVEINHRASLESALFCGGAQN